MHESLSGEQSHMSPVNGSPVSEDLMQSHCESEQLPLPRVMQTQ